MDVKLIYFYFYLRVFTLKKERKKSSHMKGLRSLTEMLLLVRIVGTEVSSFDNEMNCVTVKYEYL